jgi:lipopolysaccharide export system protein LptA
MYNVASGGTSGFLVRLGVREDSMLQHKPRLHALAWLVIGGVILSGSVSSIRAQDEPKSQNHAISYGNMRLSNYRKITVGLMGIHVVGADTTFEFKQKDRALHRLHADDIRVTATPTGYSGELSGNVHYTMLQMPVNSKQVDGSAERALYKQSKQPTGPDATSVTLIQAHVGMFRDGNEIANLNAPQVVANQQDETITGTGTVHITVRINGRHAELTADKVTWSRRANTVEASGKAHITYTGPDQKDASADADHIKIDLKNLEVEIE